MESVTYKFLSPRYIEDRLIISIRQITMSAEIDYVQSNKIVIIQ